MKDFFENELAKKFAKMIENNDDLYFDSEELVEIIIHYLEMGDLGYAELAVKHAERLHPNSNTIKIKKLEVFLELKKYQEAKNIIDELKDTHQQDIDFIVCCAKYYSSLGNPRKSILYCKKGLALKEEENFLYNFIADEYMNLGQSKDALKHYKKALEKDIQDEYAFENCMLCYSDLGERKETEIFLNDYLDQFPYSETGWFEYGQFYYRQKNYIEAIKGFDFLLAINTNSMSVYNAKAECYEALKDYSAAIAVYEELLALEFTKSITFYRIGKCYLYLKNSEQAKKAFQQSLIEDPQFSLPMMELSFIYEEKGELAESLHFAKEATSFCEDNISYQKRLAFLYIENAQYENGLASLKKITQFHPNYFFGWYAYIEVLIAIGDSETALYELQKATKLHHKAELFYQMSHCYFDLKNENEGKKYLLKAIELNSEILVDFTEKYDTIRRFLKK